MYWNVYLKACPCKLTLRMFHNILYIVYRAYNILLYCMCMCICMYKVIVILKGWKPQKRDEQSAISFISFSSSSLTRSLQRPISLKTERKKKRLIRTRRRKVIWDVGCWRRLKELGHDDSLFLRRRLEGKFSRLLTTHSPVLWNNNDLM